MSKQKSSANAKGRPQPPDAAKLTSSVAVSVEAAQCFNFPFIAHESTGYGQTEDEAKKNLAKNLDSFELDVQQNAPIDCRKLTCEKEKECVLDSFLQPQEPKCEKIKVTTRRNKLVIELWVCRQSIAIGCWCKGKN